MKLKKRYNTRGRQAETRQRRPDREKTEWNGLSKDPVAENPPTSTATTLPPSLSHLSQRFLVAF